MHIAFRAGVLRRCLPLGAAVLLDEDAEHPAGLLALELHVDDLGAVRARDRVDDRIEPRPIDGERSALGCGFVHLRGTKQKNAAQHVGPRV